MYIKEKIETIKDNGSYGILIEVGAGCPVYNELCMHPNTASRIIKFAESPNSWTYNQKKYNHSNVRAISPEICEKFIKSVHTEDFSFVLVNTIQIANNDTTQTHGWFGMQYEDDIKYYHFSILDKTTDRLVLTKIIAQIGLDILASCNNTELLDNGYVDQILDENFNQLKKETLTNLINNKLAIKNYNNTTVIFKPDNSMIRFNDYLRSVQNSKIIIFKGSFNPVHSQHIELINNSKMVLETENVILSISVHNRDITKKVDVDNLFKRIQILNELGYYVLIDCLGTYHDSYINFINSPDYKKIKLNYIMGTDIIQRFLKDEIFIYNKESVSTFNTKWNQCRFYYYHRDNTIVKIDKRINNVFYLGFATAEISSTIIRKLLENNNQHKDLINLVGNDILNLYLKYEI